MGRTDTIREGMPVYGMDDQPVGTVEQLHGDGIHVDGRHIPRSAIRRVANNRVYLRGAAVEYITQTSGAR